MILAIVIAVVLWICGIVAVLCLCAAAKRGDEIAERLAAERREDGNTPCKGAES